MRYGKEEKTLRGFTSHVLYFRERHCHFVRDRGLFLMKEKLDIK